MRREFANQFDHFWRTFESVLSDFDEQSWSDLGYGRTKPNGLAFHILLSTKYYIQDSTPVILENGETFEADLDQLKPDEWPTKDDIKCITDVLKYKTKDWLLELDFDGVNEEFKWTGKTMGSVVLFLLRHSQYHLGEMNSLLNEHLNGKAEDYFANTLQ